MTRPFLFMGIAALVASFIALKAGITEVILVLLFSMAVLIIYTVWGKKQILKGVVIALIFIVLTVRFTTLMAHIDTVNSKLAGRTAEIVGTVTGVIYNEENFSRYTVKIEDSTSGAAVGITVDATMFSHTSALPGDRIKATVVFEKVDQRYKGYNFSNGRYFSCEIESMYVEEKQTLTVWRIAHDIRQSIIKAISMGGSGEEGAVLRALIIGDTSGISERFNSNVKAAGVSHMLVVSGMHLGIICGVLINAIRRRTKRWITAVIGILTAGFITLVCLFHVSILRASIAYFVMLIGRVIRRDPDGLSSLGFGATVAVLIYPYIFHNVAFLLSLTATFAVLYPADMLIKAVSFEKLGLFQKPVRYAYDILTISVCAMFCTLPVVVYYFGYVALVAPITNLAVTFAVNAALILGVIATAVYFVPFIGGLCCIPLYFAARIFVSYFIFTVNMIGGSGYGVLTIPPDKNIYCFLVAVSFILLVKVFYQHQIRKKERAYLAERQNP